MFDCNVFIQAAANEESAAARALDLPDADAITLFVSDAVLSEIQDVLSRPYIRQLMPSITDERVDALFRRKPQLMTSLTELSIDDKRAYQTTDF